MCWHPVERSSVRNPPRAIELPDGRSEFNDVLEGAVTDLLHIHRPYRCHSTTSPSPRPKWRTPRCFRSRGAGASGAGRDSHIDPTGRTALARRMPATSAEDTRRSGVARIRGLSNSQLLFRETKHSPSRVRSSWSSHAVSPSRVSIVISARWPDAPNRCR
jgi:hypothetical protein